MQTDSSPVRRHAKPLKVQSAKGPSQCTGSSHVVGLSVVGRPLPLCCGRVYSRPAVVSVLVLFLRTLGSLIGAAVKGWEPSGGLHTQTATHAALSELSDQCDALAALSELSDKCRKHRNGTVCTIFFTRTSHFKPSGREGSRSKGADTRTENEKASGSWTPARRRSVSALFGVVSSWVAAPVHWDRLGVKQQSSGGAKPKISRYLPTVREKLTGRRRQPVVTMSS